MFRDNKPLVEFVLRILPGKDQLELISSETQVDLKRIMDARSVALDALAKDKPGMKLELFWSIQNAIRSKAGWAAWGLLIGNVCFFIPLGYMLSYLHLGMMKNKVWIWILVCIGFSVAIEVMQYVTGRGFMDVDDVVCNGVGGTIGAVLANIIANRMDRVVYGSKRTEWENRVA